MSPSYKSFFLKFFSANFAVRFLGFVKDMMLGWIIGPSKLLDIFFFLITMPMVLTSTWNKALETVFLSRFEQDLHDAGSQPALENIRSATYNFTLISMIIYALVSTVFPFVIYHLYPLYITPFLVQIIFIISFVFVIETFLLSIKVKCYSGQRFFLPTILPISQSILIIAGLLVKEKPSLLFLAVLFTCGALMQLVFFVQKEFRFFLRIKIAHFDFSTVRYHLKGVSQLALASGLSSLNLLIDQSFALKLGEGANTYIHYGNYFLIVFTFLIVNNISTIYFPQFQKYVLQEQQARLAADTQKITRILLVINVIIVILIINNGYFVLKTILGYGRISDYDLLMIYYCALGYSGAFLGLGLNAILTRVLHVHKKYHVIVWVAATNAILNILFNIIFTIWFGVWGIALSTSITLLILISIYIIYLNNNFKINVFKNVNYIWIRKFTLATVLIIVIEAWYLRFHYTITETDLIGNILIFLVSMIILSALFLIFGIIKLKHRKIII